MLIIVILAVIAAMAIVLRPKPEPQLTLLASRRPAPKSFQKADRYWYWIEAGGKPPQRLVRSAGAEVQTITTADRVTGYAIEKNRIAWSERNDSRWSINISALNGSGKRSLWIGDDEPLGLSLAEGQAFWLHRVPAPAPLGDPFPPLSATLEVDRVAADGGAPGVAARLWEAQDGVVLGAHDGTLYVAAYRHTNPGNCCLYRISPVGATAVRVAGESGKMPALFAQNGSLYWLASSSEASAATCLKHLTTQGTIETLSDWLPVEAELFETERGVICLDRVSRPNVWITGQQDVFPEPVNVPADYNAVAAGGHELLLAHNEGSLAIRSLYRMPLP